MTKATKDSVIGSLGVATTLWVVRRGKEESHAEDPVYLLEKLCHKLWSVVGLKPKG